MKITADVTGIMWAIYWRASAFDTELGETVLRGTMCCDGEEYGLEHTFPYRTRRPAHVDASAPHRRVVTPVWLEGTPQFTEIVQAVDAITGDMTTESVVAMLRAEIRKDLYAIVMGTLLKRAVAAAA